MANNASKFFSSKQLYKHGAWTVPLVNTDITTYICCLYKIWYHWCSILQICFTHNLFCHPNCNLIKCKWHANDVDRFDSLFLTRKIFHQHNFYHHHCRLTQATLQPVDITVTMMTDDCNCCSDLLITSWTLWSMLLPSVLLTLMCLHPVYPNMVILHHTDHMMWVAPLTNFSPFVRKAGTIEGGGFTFGFSLKCAGPFVWFSLRRRCNSLAEDGINLWVSMLNDCSLYYLASLSYFWIKLMKTFNFAVSCSSLKSLYDLFNQDLIAWMTL